MMQVLYMTSEIPICYRPFPYGIAQRPHTSCSFHLRVWEFYWNTNSRSNDTLVKFEEFIPSWYCLRLWVMENGPKWPKHNSLGPTRTYTVMNIHKLTHAHTNKPTTDYTNFTTTIYLSGHSWVTEIINGLPTSWESLWHLVADQSDARSGCRKHRTFTLVPC